jgi:ABC-type uncharacterized transport system permease subunit
LLIDEHAFGRRARFSRWRRDRPFWGATLLVASGLLLLLPAYTTFHVGDVLITISTISGVSTLLLGALMVLCGVASLLRPSVKLPAGVSAMIIALVALPAANFGGFIIGTLLGIVGASLVLAWTDSTSSQVPAERATDGQL